jgi:uncharacterized protein (DUF302 family)
MSNEDKNQKKVSNKMTHNNLTKLIAVGLLSFILGVFLTGIGMFLAAPSLMLLEDQSMYDFDTTLEVLLRTTEENGWKVPVVHDLQETMAKYGKQVDRVKVVELCHPDHAYLILKESDERIVSALMPCRVSIYEKADGKVYISRLNSGLMGKMMKGVVPKVMSQASLETEEILNSII